MESSLLEKLIIKGCCTDKDFIATLSSSFEQDYFDNKTAGKVYDYLVKHFQEFGKVAPKSVVISEFDVGGAKDVAEFFRDVESIDFNYVNNYDFLFKETNEYLKEKAVKDAFLKGVGIINRKEDFSSLRPLMDEALAKDLRIDLGTDYFGTLQERLTRLMGSGAIRVPTGFPTLDEYITGGIPPYTLSVIVARIHGFKSTFLANLCARQVMMNKNIVLATLEMSEDAFSQRFDSIFSLLDINKMYREKSLKLKLIKKLGELKSQAGRGNLFIKQYPTGKATVDDYRKYLRELRIRGINIDEFVCDYINLMKSQYKTKGDMYQDVKSISEELRAMSFEFKIPVVSVSQLNREGMNITFDEVDFTYISESIGVAATADFVAIFGSGEDKAVYESELFYKIVKNRLGGRVGVVDKLYYDQRNLKMYDSSEQDMWMDDATVSTDTRKMAEVQADPVQQSRGRRSRRER